MKNISNNTPSRTPTRPLTESEDATLLHDENHIEQCRKLNNDSRPRYSRDTHRWNRTPSEHEEWIESEIHDSTDDESIAVGLCIAIRIENTIKRIGEEKNDRKRQHRHYISKRKCLNRRRNIASQRENSWRRDEQCWSQYNDEDNREKDDMLEDIRYLFFVICTESIADKG